MRRTSYRLARSFPQLPANIAARAVFLPLESNLTVVDLGTSKAPKRFSESDFDSCDASTSEAAAEASAASRDHCQQRLDQAERDEWWCERRSTQLRS
jgi:hypothetical protein